MKPWAWALLIMGGALYLAGFLYFHDRRVRQDALAQHTSDSLDTVRKRNDVVRDSLIRTERARADSLAHLAQQQTLEFTKSQDARTLANAAANDLRRQLKVLVGATDTTLKSTLTRVDAIDSLYNLSLAHKDSVIAQQDRSILLYQRMLADRDQALLRLNQDIRNLTTDRDAWRKRAGHGKGFLEQVVNYTTKGLAIKGGLDLILSRR